MDSTREELVLEEQVLGVERVVGLGELLGTADQVADHHFCACPGQQLVDALPAVLQQEGQVVAQAEQLRKVYLDSGRSLVLEF